MTGRWKISIRIESSIILNQSHQSFLGHGTECQKKEKQKLEFWVSVRPQHLQTNLWKQSKGRWATKSSSKRSWVWGAKGLLPSVQWTSLPGAVNCHDSNVASTGPREGKEHMGGKRKKKIKEMSKGGYRSSVSSLLSEIYCIPAHGDIPCSPCILCPALSLLTNSGPFVCGKREHILKQAERDGYQKDASSIRMLYIEHLLQQLYALPRNKRKQKESARPCAHWCFNLIRSQKSKPNRMFQWAE